jgi:hypothetical protein
VRRGIGRVTPQEERRFTRLAARAYGVGRIHEVDRIDPRVSQIVECDRRQTPRVRERDQAAEVLHRPERRIDAVPVDGVEAAEAVAPVGGREDLDGTEPGRSKIVERHRGARGVQRESALSVLLGRHARDCRR